MAKCPKCSTAWPAGSEQALCIARHGECIVCRFVPRGERNPHGSGDGVAEEFDALRIAPNTTEGTE